MAESRKSKTIFTPLLLLSQVFLRSKIDNFLGGLIIGAIFSLLVNFMTVQAQEAITKYKYLESLEQEIFTHAATSNWIKTNVKESREKNQHVNPYSFFERYDTSVWDSGAILGYLYDLDPQIWTSLTNYYTGNLQIQNRFLDNTQQFVNQLDRDHRYCLLQENSASRCSLTKRMLEEGSAFAEEEQLGSASVVYDSSIAILKEFHPSQDRKNNLILKLLMGNRTIRDIGENKLKR